MITKKLLPILFLSMTMCLAKHGITREEFNAAVTTNGYPTPKEEVYQNFVESTQSFSREEAAMFIAQLLRESAGFQFVEELACINGRKCNYVDSVGLPGKEYHGRGYIQLTYGANYKAASQGLGMDNYLLEHPEVVATSKKIAMQVSVWYWEARVRPKLVGKENQFGITTRAINGGECTKASLKDRALHRWKLYLKVADTLKIKNKAIENGCYAI